MLQRNPTCRNGDLRQPRCRREDTRACDEAVGAIPEGMVEGTRNTGETRMIIGYRKQPLGESYFYGTIGGSARKFIRLLCGAILPGIYDRQNGVVVVLGELYRPSGPMNLLAIAAKAGTWKDIESALVSYRRQLKFNCLVLDCDGARHMVLRIPGLSYAMAEIPMLTSVAPKTAFTEAGKQRVDSLIAEGRLHMEDIKHVLDAEPEIGRRALEAAVTWVVEHPAHYQARRKQPEYGRIWGTEGL